ncbi:Imm7 family immunity protein [Streptomyces microflavus]|uniref:Imm7 family immunity protein n=1 Tax=Streptomyces microflavus TaxID=1919 RepID=UPI0036BC1F3D
MTIRRAALLCNQRAAGRRPADQAAIVVGGSLSGSPQPLTTTNSPAYGRSPMSFAFASPSWTARTCSTSGGRTVSRSSPDVAELFEHVAEVAPGSYGLLHVRDDEDPGHENEVRVLRLVRGRVTQHTETLLSPCIPTVEDPFTG